MLYIDDKIIYGHVLKGLNNFYQINYSHTNGAGCYITGAGCYIFVKVMQIKTTKLPIASIYNTYQTQPLLTNICE